MGGITYKAMNLEEFRKEYVLSSINKRRKFLFDRFLEEFEIIRKNCYAYQIILIGSFVTERNKELKEKPGDIDVCIRAFTRPTHAEFLPKHLRNRSPLIPFYDFDNFCDIIPVSPFVTNNPEYVSTDRMIDDFNKTNKFQTDFAVVIEQFQRMPSITTIDTIDRNGGVHSFIVDEGYFLFKGLKGIEFKITKSTLPSFRYFEFKIIHLLDERILIYMINNHDVPEFSGKGIVKAMIKSIAKMYKKDVVSSTNNEELKLDATEGRIPDVTQFWRKRENELDNVTYLPDEDRFQFKFEEEQSTGSMTN